MVKKPREDGTRHPLDLIAQQHPCKYCGGTHMTMQCPTYVKMCTSCGKTRHFKKVCQSRRDRAVNKLEIEELQKCSKGEIESVSIDSVHLNKNWSLIMAELEM